MTLYFSTPIYYVNDRPHIGHLYSSVVADVLARYHRQHGRSVWLSTGTDEHALKVVEAAARDGRAAHEFAALHAHQFREAFDRFDVSYDSFIRTSDERHIAEVTACCEQLLKSGDAYLGRFQGWYDAGEEEYVAESKAAAQDYRGVNGQPLVRREEENYFFRLSRFQERIQSAIERGELRITPEARRAEVLSRLREPLRDVPISRKTDYDWGVPVPGAPEHRVYVWIDALLNYRTVSRAAGLSQTWPPRLHLIGKEILWFHAVLWPGLLFALQDATSEDISLPRQIHAHSHWTHGGVKISKTLGNAVTEQDLLALADGPVAIDITRYFFAARGPIAAADADFSREDCVQLYNADLANGLGNALSRVLGLLEKYLDGAIPETEPSEYHVELRSLAEECQTRAGRAIDELDLPTFVDCANGLVRRVNGLIQATEPYRLLRSSVDAPRGAAILAACLEALLFAAELLDPVVPRSIARVRRALGVETSEPSYGKLSPGARVNLPGPLFPRLT